MKPLDEFAALKTLDPASGDPDPHSPRAQASLERIVATDPSYDVPPHRLRRPLVRAAVATAAIAIGAAVVLVPRSGLLPNGDAYAGWTAAPSGLSPKEYAGAVADCRYSLESTGPSNSAQVAMAERRGKWAIVVLKGPPKFQGYCMTNVVDYDKRSGYGGSAGPNHPPVGPRELAVLQLGAVGGKQAGYVTSAIGWAGSDIVGLTYTSPKHGVVKATVKNGFFAFWVPGFEFVGPDLVPVQVRYRDGTTAATTIQLS
ncbi:hypothetical protein ACFTSF_21380 [Kribbella sp. NPDC056951]|uniref:hypothetical protein n=1 Tax=Kribbella sp. NPDC056951 TaxID=3345978 RepID=UPI00363821EF